MATLNLKMWTYDDYREGRNLYWCDEDGNHPDEEKESVYDVEFPVEPDKYSVFHLELLYDDQPEPTLLRSFENYKDAELYAKQQYYHFSDNFPFVTTGLTCAYHPKGDRPEISVEGTEREIVETNRDSYNFILIVATNHIEGHSLGPFDIW